MRRSLPAFLATLVVGLSVLALAPPASAQVGYPPPVCPAGDTVIDAGTHAIGETFVVRLQPLCLWDPGSPVTVTVNGQSVGVKIADAGGGVNVTITVLSATELSIDDPVLVRGGCGDNNASGIGFSSAAGRDVRATALFRVVCPAPAPARAAARAGVAFTGANVLRWSLIAAGLLGLGAVFVVVARRRRESGTTA